MKFWKQFMEVLKGPIAWVALIELVFFMVINLLVKLQELTLKIPESLVITPAMLQDVSLVPESLVSNLYAYIIRVVIILILSMLIVYFVYSVSRVLMWNLIQKKKWSWKGLLKFMGGMLAWALLGIIPGIVATTLIGLILQIFIFIPIVGQIIATLLLWIPILWLLMLTAIFQLTLVKTNSIKKSFLEVIHKGLKQPHKFILAHIAVVGITTALILIAFLLFFGPFKVLFSMGSTIYGYLVMVYGIVTFAWLRVYIHVITKRLK